MPASTRRSHPVNKYLKSSFRNIILGAIVSGASVGLSFAASNTSFSGDRVTISWQARLSLGEVACALEVPVLDVFRNALGFDHDHLGPGLQELTR